MSFYNKLVTKCEPNGGEDCESFVYAWVGGQRGQPLMGTVGLDLMQFGPPPTLTILNYKLLFNVRVGFLSRWPNWNLLFRCGVAG